MRGKHAETVNQLEEIQRAVPVIALVLAVVALIVAAVAMAYNRGQAGARAAWEAGITSNDYTDAVLEALERWECTVNAWAGE